MGKTKNSSRSKTIKIIKIKKKFKEKVLREVFVLPSNPLSTWKISFFFIKKSNGKSIINADNNKDKEKTITILIASRVGPRIVIPEEASNMPSTSRVGSKIFHFKKNIPIKLSDFVVAHFHYIYIVFYFYFFN